MQSWKRPVDCTTSETRTVSGGSRPNENLIPEKVYFSGSLIKFRFGPGGVRLPDPPPSDPPVDWSAGGVM